MKWIKIQNNLINQTLLYKIYLKKKEENLFKDIINKNRLFT